MDEKEEQRVELEIGLENKEEFDLWMQETVRKNEELNALLKGMPVPKARVIEISTLVLRRVIKEVVAETLRVRIQEAFEVGKDEVEGAPPE